MRSLGVNGAYCHVVGEWEKDDKEVKQIARGMMLLNGTVNTQLKQIKGLQADKPTVTCYTCYRGQAKPVTRLSDAGTP